MINRVLLVFLGLLLAGCGKCQVRQSPPTVQRVLIVSIDGLRPDVLLRAGCPTIQALARRGCYTYWAQTIDPPVTLPSHVSMLTGVTPEKHGIYVNLDWSYQWENMPSPAVPTLFQKARAAGLSTALVSGKAKFEAIAGAGSLDWFYVPESYAQDLDVAQRAAEIIRQHRPQVMFVHFPNVDASGHSNGWGSDQQLQAARQADQALAIVLGALRKAGLLDTTAVIVTADHGGSGWGHWRTAEPNKHIPWIIAGPRIKQNLDLTRYPYRDIRTCDTFATACYLMKIPIEEDVIDGRPVLEVIDRKDLLYDTEPGSPGEF